jgi:hypothetical protein
MVVEIKDILLVYTNGMQTEGKFGGYSYSFIVDKETILKHALDAVSSSRKSQWKDEDKTPAKLLKAMNAKSKAKLVDPENYDPKFDEIIAHMRDCDVLVGVKSKTPIKATKKDPVAWFSKADIIIEMYTTEYQGKQFVSRVAPPRCSVKVTKYEKMPEDVGGPCYIEEDEEPSKTPATEGVQTYDEIPF